MIQLQENFTTKAVFLFIIGTFPPIHCKGVVNLGLQNCNISNLGVNLLSFLWCYVIERKTKTSDYGFKVTANLILRFVEGVITSRLTEGCQQKRTIKPKTTICNNNLYMSLIVSFEHLEIS